MSEDLNDPWIGQDVASYTIVRRVGEGGMGIIYQAKHHSLHRMAAIKFLPASLASNGAYVELFLREANAAAGLNHPNIISVYDAGSIGSDVYFFIMEYVEGRDLRSILDERGTIPVADAVSYVRQAAAALGYAHKKNIIHRDIKPENILLTDDGTIKIADLGLAKWMGEKSSMLTQTGEFLGSPVYISPERLRDPEHIDQRTDIYSLGASLFHLVTGKIPYDGSSPVIMAGHLDTSVPDPRDVDPTLDATIAAIIMKMMAKDPNDRYQRMEEVVAALEQNEEPAVLPAAPAAAPAAVPPANPVAKAAPPRNWTVPVVAAVTLMLLVAGIFYWLRSRERPVASPPPPAPKAALPAPAPVVKKSTVADFNDGKPHNNLNGAFGIWNSEGRDPPAKCSQEIAQGAGPDQSDCWRIVCGISTPRTFGGTWMNLNRLDGSGYNTLSFKARTDQPSLDFLVECKIKPANVQIAGKQIAVHVNQEWQTIEIPLKSFALPSLEALDQFVFIFNQEVTGPKDAVLWVDDMELVKK